MKLTTQQLKDMLPGQTLMITCDTILEWNTARQRYYRLRARYRRPDGWEYKITHSSHEKLITISLTPPQNPSAHDNN